MIEVRVSDYMLMDGLAVLVTEKFPGGDRRILRLAGVRSREWETPSDPAVITEPTFILTNDEARALLDALLRHYQGASDMHTVRQDLLHERGRVDRLLDTVTELAARPQQLHVHKAEQ